ncbi:DNA primase/helicase, TOPRIM [Cellulophaga phage phi10:1]|uniref:DNA primase/helicase, TOPRIM n=1 Tax=Cellulophaga phage phi10:1 TaxID=1327981 RepID=S0A1J9_9CAUD|nr:DNA primase/helicase, TOPRIM [Cellulophaga phage phi10:1]AGO48367.1 DNA primase/helicase, TOPRIM [Cellulophaga phage phi10:1]
MEINGFTVDEYNVHKIKDGASASTCPKCSHERKKKTDKCMSVFWDTGLGSCNHCGEVTQLHTYKKKNEIKVYSRPEPKEKSKLSDVVVNWFKEERHISEQTLIDLKISESVKWMPKAKKEINTIEFNYFLHGELVNVKSRGKNKDFMFEKNCELIMYNIDSIIGQNECILVEGEPDALAWHESGYKKVSSVPNGFTLPKPDGSSTINLSYLDNYYFVFENIEKIYLGFDNDTAGNEGTKEFIRRMGAEKCYLIDYADCKDGNEYLKKYGKEALLKLKEEAKLVPLEGIKTIKDVDAELVDFWLNGAPRGKTVDMEGLDECASFVNKQYTLLVSAPNSGKSDLIDHFTSKFSIKYGDKVGICSTENKPLHFHYDKIFKKINGNRPNANNYQSEIVLNTKAYVEEHFFHVDQESRYYLEDVLAKFAELVKRKGCRWFVLDPFNKIDLKDFSKTDINKYTAEYHQKIDEFVTKYDCHLFLVVHPTKMQLKEGSDKTFIMPTAYNIKGGGEHFDMSYNIIGLVRDHERGVVQIRTLKWKFQHLGNQGVDTWFGWNINNGRYTKPDGYYDSTTTDQPSFTWDNSNWLFTNKEETRQEFQAEEKPIKYMSPSEAFAPLGEEEKEDEVPF